MVCWSDQPWLASTTATEGVAQWVSGAVSGAVAEPNTLIFVDFPTSEPERAAAFYREVFGWEVEPRPEGVFYRIVPGGEFPLDDGSPSGVGNLHLGLFDAATAMPDPNQPPAGGTEAPPRSAWAPRIYVLVSDDDSEDAILARAEGLGAEVLWRGWYWKEFNGFHAAFRDPWGSEIILWSKAGDDPEVAPGRTVDESR